MFDWRRHPQLELELTITSLGTDLLTLINSKAQKIDEEEEGGFVIQSSNNMASDKQTQDDIVATGDPPSGEHYWCTVLESV